MNILVGLLCGLFLLLVVVLINKLSKTNREAESLKKRNAELEGFAAIVPESEAKADKILFDAQRQADLVIAEAQTHAARILEQAQKEAAPLYAQAEQALNAAKDESGKIRQNAKDYAARLSEKADTIFRDAQTNYGRILAEAERHAKEIAGDAYDALQRAKDLDATAKAMKNIIEGYGDRYLIPSYSLLDELAEEFSFAEAGEKLRQAREHTRQMCENGLAATCDYAEKNRRETAIRFVLDAFNGKVDSVLSRSKLDNFGTLRQKLDDAFHIVNDEGSAFRNARILPEYLAARTEELKWAILAQELKEKAKEEQRRIKEQMREEEKARREYERAMKEAAKEEETLRKAMEKARLEIQKASAEQRDKYEAKLVELQEKLKAAEEKNQRALSMAQQTKRGHVYVISNIGSFGEEVYKIGMTRRLEPLERIKELGDASVPFEFDVHAMITYDDAPALEHG
ncbi:MAG: DUF4041 domain-containing protein [Myxococcales bacterium]|nr:MAG: DUF4041 domain-containing protein [Myxococcales bacterium]